MSKKTFYRQCHLVKKTASGSDSHQTSWIPEKFAILGKVVKLRGPDDQWDDGWVVKTVSQTRREDDDMPDAHDAVKRHRKATGDAMPKKVSS